MTESGCLICQSELQYHSISKQSCSICKKTFESTVSCINGHYVCDKCHTEAPLEFLRHYINTSESIDPSEMLQTIMAHPSFALHGPEHHYLIPAVILTAIKNMGHKVPEDYLEQIFHRGGQLPGGTCGYWGACAAALGAGVSASILTLMTPMKQQFYGVIHAINAEVLKSIADYGGPRCCKRNTFLALQGTIKAFQEHFNIDFPEVKPFVCSYFKKNAECLLRQCPFFKAGGNK